MKKIIDHIKNIFAIGLVVSVVSSTAVGAAALPLDQSCAGQGSTICASKDQKLFGPGSVWLNIVNTLIYVIGAVAVVMVIIGGLRYVVSGGDASSTKAAKDTILYAIIGVVIAAFSYAIVNFVLSKL